MSDTRPSLLTFVKHGPRKRLDEFLIRAQDGITLSSPSGLWSATFTLSGRHPQECTSSTQGYIALSMQRIYDYVLNFERLGLGTGYELAVNQAYLTGFCEVMLGVNLQCRLAGADLRHIGKALLLVEMLFLRHRLKQKRMVEVEVTEYPVDEGSGGTIKLVDVTIDVLGVSTSDFVSGTATSARHG
jgi:hypothetical protein